MNYPVKSLIILLTAVLLPGIHAYSLNGAWRGELALGQMKLPIVFNFTETADGITECTLDSPAQGAKGIPATVTACTADSLALTCGTIGASYRGRITPKSIKGTFSQNGHSFQLDLAPEIPLEERRPQTPRPPFPYNVTDTVFTAPDGALMSASLTLPPASAGKKIPAVVMVTGSGPQNRDEELFEHRPFAVIADYLARNGIASLRYDDRGTGKSEGDFLTATTDTLKNDALGGIEFLRTIPEIGKTGVLGHSEGGTIAFMLGAEGNPDFIISLAGMAIPGKETMLRQNSSSLDKTGLMGQEKDDCLKLIGRLFDTMAAQRRNGTVNTIDIDSIIATTGLKVNPMIAQSLKMTQKTRTPWMDAFIGLDPREYLKQAKCPLLAINGDKDTQVDADNLSVIKEFAPQSETMLMPGLNHLMQHAVTGEPSEYGEIRETISPEVLEAITKFINSLQ